MPHRPLGDLKSRAIQAILVVYSGPIPFESCRCVWGKGGFFANGVYPSFAVRGCFRFRRGNSQLTRRLGLRKRHLSFLRTDCFGIFHSGLRRLEIATHP